MGFRQTNIIWVAFVAAQALGPLLIHTIHVQRIEQSKPIQFSLKTSGQIWELLEGTFMLISEPWRLLKLILDALKICGGYVIVWLLFVAFIVWNDGIVVGDRSAHTASFHPTQVLYFCLFSLAFSAPFCISRVKVFVHHARKHFVLFGFAVFIIYVIVEGYTLAHEYLLADNRHYTFYFWRRIIVRNEWSKYVFIPLYLFGGFCIMNSVQKASIIFKITYPLLVIINLTPQLLLEFRYFIIPYLLYRLQVRPQTWWKLLAEFLIYILVNAFVIMMFLYKPFRWPHEPEQVQRFIW